MKAHPYSSGAAPGEDAPPDTGARPIRVLALYGSIPFYGKERADIQLFTSLREAGVDALFVTDEDYGHENIQPALDERGIAWTTAPWAGVFSTKMSASTWANRLWKMARGSFQLVRIASAYRPTHLFISTMRFFFSMLPALFVLRTPIVWHVCDAPEVDHRASNILWRRLIIPRVSRFVCVSDYVKREFLRLGAPEDKLEVIHDYPMERASVPPGEHISLLPFDGYTISYIGQLTHQKGVDLLVDTALSVCQERPDVRFLLAGGYAWNNPFAEALIERVQSEGYGNRIQFLGYVEDIPGLLAASDLLVCPSRYEEPLGLVVVEAKQVGVPSVVFPSGGLQELVNHKVDGYICRSKSAEALREGIEAMLAVSAETLKKMGCDARTSLDPLGFNKTTFTKAWRDVFERV